MNIARILRRSRRPSAVLGCVLLAALGAAGCRTATPPPTAHAPTPPPTAQAPASPPPAAVTIVVDGPPRVVVTPDGGAYLVLAAGPSKMGSTIAWTVAYVAAADRRAPGAGGAGERLRATADAVFLAQLVPAEAASAEVVSIAALFGRPGEPGVSLEFTYERAANGWHRSPTPVRTEVTSMPSVPAALERYRADEDAAVEVALRFLAHVDHLELDDAWDLSSVVLKATLSRATFEEQLRAGRLRDDPTPRQEMLRSFTVGPFIPGAGVEVQFARRFALEIVELRLDDDMQWRVAGLGTFARGDPDPPSVTAAVDWR